MSQIVFCFLRDFASNILSWNTLANGPVERKHQHILYVVRALRFQETFTINFWGDCILVAGHLINRTPSSILQGKTPYEVLFGKPPSYVDIYIFGCLCYAHKCTQVRGKFDE